MKTGKTFKGTCVWSGNPVSGFILSYKEWLESNPHIDRSEIIGYICPSCGVVSDSRVNNSGIAFSWWSGFEKSRCKKCNVNIQPTFVVSEASFSKAADKLIHQKSNKKSTTEADIIKKKPIANKPEDPHKIPCKECGTMILPATAYKTDGLCMPCYKKTVKVEKQPGQRWKILFGLVMVLISIMLAIHITCTPDFPVETIHVAPGKSATCNLKSNKSYFGTYYIGSASAKILTELPPFLKVNTDADMDYGFLEKRTVGNPVITIIASADSNAAAGIFTVKGRWQWQEYKNTFKIKIKITQ